MAAPSRRAPPASRFEGRHVSRKRVWSHACFRDVHLQWPRSEHGHPFGDQRDNRALGLLRSQIGHNDSSLLSEVLVSDTLGAKHGPLHPGLAKGLKLGATPGGRAHQQYLVEQPVRQCSHRGRRRAPPKNLCALLPCPPRIHWPRALSRSEASSSSAMPHEEKPPAKMVRSLSSISAEGHQRVSVRERAPDCSSRKRARCSTPESCSYGINMVAPQSQRNSSPWSFADMTGVPNTQWSFLALAIVVPPPR